MTARAERARGASSPRLRSFGAALCAVAIFAVNAIVCSRLFFLNYSVRMDSIEGAYMSISAYVARHWSDHAWFPLWYGGMPFEHVYQPGLHVTVAMLASVAHW